MAEVMQPVYQKKFENEYADFLKFMSDQIKQRVNNQVFKAMDENTKDKFEDAQTGNWSVVFKTLANRVNAKLKRQFSDKRIDDLTKKVLKSEDKVSQKAFYSSVEEVVGISQKELVAREAMNAQTNALIAETAQWAKRYRDQILDDYVANSLRMMASGSAYEEVVKEFNGLMAKKKTNGAFIARNQVASFNSLQAKVRAQKIGVKKAIWKTANDERVRGNPSGKYPNAKPSHYALNGKEFVVSEGIESNGTRLYPSLPANCRCRASFIIDDSALEGEK